jgi:prepilin-type N-terminal cleavage/methylation domain-containing protein
MTHKNSDSPVFIENHLRAGASLIEVILSVVIIAILATFAANALFFPTRQIVGDTVRQIALHQAQRDMETVRAERVYDVIVPTNYSFTAARDQLTLDRAIDDTGGKKIITVQVNDDTGQLLVELITERTP